MIFNYHANETLVFHLALFWSESVWKSEMAYWCEYQQNLVTVTWLIITKNVLLWEDKFSPHYKPQARFSGDSDVQRRDLRIFLKGEAPSLLFWTKGYITSRDPEPILKLSTMFVLLSNLSSLTLNPVYLKWTPSVVGVYLFVEGRGSRVPCRGRGCHVEGRG